MSCPSCSSTSLPVRCSLPSSSFCITSPPPLPAGIHIAHPPATVLHSAVRVAQKRAQIGGRSSNYWRE
jgi:hypothetical protein